MSRHPFAEEIIDEIGDEQDWDDESKLALCLQFIDEHKLARELRAFLREVQKDEKAEDE